MIFCIDLAPNYSDDPIHTYSALDPCMVSCLIDRTAGSNWESPIHGQVYPIVGVAALRIRQTYVWWAAPSRYGMEAFTSTRLGTCVGLNRPSDGCMHLPCYLIQASPLQSKLNIIKSYSSYQSFFLTQFLPVCHQVLLIRVIIIDGVVHTPYAVVVTIPIRILSLEYFCFRQLMNETYP